MIKHGRQTAPTLDGIRDDHLKRYELAIALGAESRVERVLDLGCGTGYGSYMMACAGYLVDAFEIDASAVDYGEQHYASEHLQRHVADLSDYELPYHRGHRVMATAFEFIEHTTVAPGVLKQLSMKSDVLVASVPNENVVPFETSKHRQHVRHYTPDEFREELEACGWRVKEMGCQIGKRGQEAKIRWSTTHGRTLIAYAEAK